MNNSNMSESIYKIEPLNLNRLSCSSYGCRLLRNVSTHETKRNQWGLYWVNSHGLTVDRASQTVSLTPNTLLLIYPNTPVKCALEDEANGKVKFFYLHFNLGIPYDLMCDNVLHLPLTEPLSYLLNKLLAMPVQHRELHNDFRLNLALQALVFSVLSEISATKWPTPPTDSRIVDVLHFIEDNPSEKNKSNTMLAKYVNMSVNAFIRLFKQQTSKSPQTYIMERRLQRGEIELLHTEKTIEEIADNCGFCDRGHFSRTFKEKYGIGPGKYRKESLHFL